MMTIVEVTRERRWRKGKAPSAGWLMAAACGGGGGGGCVRDVGGCIICNLALKFG